MSAKTSSGNDQSRLVARRRQSRRRAFFAFSVILLIAAGVAVYGLRQPPTRITHVTIYGADQTLADGAMHAMAGSYLGVIPRDSTFFFPESSIRAAILASDPTIAAVSIFRDGLTGLSIKVDHRVPVSRWCGPTPVLPAHAASSTAPETDGAVGEAVPSQTCYVFDVDGLLYATSTDTALVNAFVVYEPFTAAQDAATSSALGLTLPHVERFPAAFDFARGLTRFGSPVTAIAFRDDEVDDYLASGTRVTYVLGTEQEAYTALVSADASLDLADGSLEYVDLRFPGKVYLKKVVSGK